MYAVFRIIGIDTASQSTMYKDELQDIGSEAPQVFSIEKIVQTKGKCEHKQYLVKWYGYDSSHNSWISANEYNAG